MHVHTDTGLIWYYYKITITHLYQVQYCLKIVTCVYIIKTTFILESHRNDAKESTISLCEHGGQSVSKRFQACIQSEKEC